MVTEEESKTPKEQKYTPRATSTIENGENRENNLFSPTFKSVAAMAGWDEETLLIASLIVDDTPDREFKTKKRSDLTFKTPPSNSRRKRRDHKKSPGPASISATTLNLDEEETTKKEEKEISKTPSQRSSKKDKIKAEKEKSSKDSADSESSSSFPCIDKLREELSCAICLDVCFEPSTTPCGHSFCKKCLRSAADKCGKRCPKCRQIISNGRSCTVNTVLWNTIQLLFPNEVAARKASSISESQDAAKPRASDRDHHRNHDNSRRSSLRSANSNRSGSEVILRRRRGVPPVQEEDAALALRLQREEFMQAIRGTDDNGGRISVAVARANLRAMASRAMNIRIRSRYS